MEKISPLDSGKICVAEDNSNDLFAPYRPIIGRMQALKRLEKIYYYIEIRSRCFRRIDKSKLRLANKTERFLYRMNNGPVML